MAGKRKDRFPQLRTSGPGYETGDKERFDYRVQFEFDYSNLDKSARQVRKELSDFSYELSKLFSGKGIGSNRSGDKMFYITPKQAEPFAQGRNNKSESFNLMPDGVQMTSALKDGMQGMGKAGADTMRKYVKRIDTGRMKDAITYNTRSRGNKYTVNIGWTELWYKYFGFQENGTKNGVPPMHSILRTYLEMLPRVQNYMSRFIRSYTRGSGDQYAGKGVKF